MQDITRQQFMYIFGLDEDNMEDLELDDDHENGESWSAIAKGMIEQLNYFVNKNL